MVYTSLPLHQNRTADSLSPTIIPQLQHLRLRDPDIQEIIAMVIDGIVITAKVKLRTHVIWRVPHAMIHVCVEVDQFFSRKKEVTGHFKSVADMLLDGFLMAIKILTNFCNRIVLSPRNLRTFRSNGYAFPANRFFACCLHNRTYNKQCRNDLPFHNTSFYWLSFISSICFWRSMIYRVSSSTFSISRRFISPKSAPSCSTSAAVGMPGRCWCSPM